MFTTSAVFHCSGNFHNRITKNNNKAKSISETNPSGIYLLTLDTNRTPNLVTEGSFERSIAKLNPAAIFCKQANIDQ